MGILSQNAGGFGSIKEAAEVYAANELKPLRARLAQVNDWLGEEVICFRQYALVTAKNLSSVRRSSSSINDSTHSDLSFRTKRLTRLAVP
ncbi:hypothetical protein SAMN02787149_106274 [Pseudomonas sp. Snoq117.2]|nr:hypothetical protein SAMN02787149_106274 [Pseudomonas sp. Snoq117.2]